MTREKAQFDVLAKIERERLRRNWTEYTLAKNSELAQSTISTWYRKQLQPSVASIEKICNGLGITLSEFFEDESFDETSNTNSEGRAKKNITKEQHELYENWARLNPSQKKALIELLKTIDL